MKTLSDLFDVSYVNKFDLNKMAAMSRRIGGVSFVGLSARNNGVIVTVAPMNDCNPYPAGLITVALGGTPLTSFVQQYPFYTAQNVAVLIPLEEMTFSQKLYYCLCIERNKFRYSAFGREANRTLKSLTVPEINEFPDWLPNADSVTNQTASPALSVPTPDLKTSEWKPFRLDALFTLGKGQRLTKADRKPGSTPYIGALARNNGLVEYIDHAPIHPGGTITVNYNGIGGVGMAFYQPVPYWCSDDVNVLYPKVAISAGAALFIATVIRNERYRYSFGRKWHLDRMAASTIKLPANPDGQPDYKFMETYMQTLQYSSQL